MRVDGDCLAIVRAIGIADRDRLNLLRILRIFWIGFVKQVQGDGRTISLVVPAIGYQQSGHTLVGERCHVFPIDRTRRLQPDLSSFSTVGVKGVQTCLIAGIVVRPEMVLATL